MSAGSRRTGRSDRLVDNRLEISQGVGACLPYLSAQHTVDQWAGAGGHAFGHAFGGGANYPIPEPKLWSIADIQEDDKIK